MATYPVHTAETRLSRLIEQACAGEDVVIARDHEPLVRLVPLKTSARCRRFGTMRGKAVVTDAFFEPLPPEESQAWQG